MQSKRREGARAGTKFENTNQAMKPIEVITASQASVSNLDDLFSDSPITIKSTPHKSLRFAAYALEFTLQRVRNNLKVELRLLPSPSAGGEVVAAVDAPAAHFAGKTALRLPGFGFLKQHGVFVIEILQFHARDFLTNETFDGEHVGAILGGHDGEGVAGMLRPARAPDAMDVILRMLRHVVVNDVAHVRDVQPARGDVRRHEHFKSSVAEPLERLLTFLLGAVRVQHGHGVIRSEERRVGNE